MQCLFTRSIENYSSFLVEFCPIVYICMYFTMRIEHFERKSTNVSETNRAFRTEMHERFRNESNSPRLHRIAVFPAETKVDNAWITLPFFYIFLTHDELSTGRRGNADLTISLSLDLERKRYVSLACVNFREKVIRGEIKRKMSSVQRVESVVM